MSSFTSSRNSNSKSDANSEMTKANDVALSPIHTSCTTNNSPDTSIKNEKKKKVLYCFLSFFLLIFLHALLHCYIPVDPVFLALIKSILPKIFGSKRNGRGSDEDALKSNAEGDGVTLGIHQLHFFFLYRISWYSLITLPFNLIFFPFNFLCRKIWRGRLKQEEKHSWTRLLS